MKRFSLFGIVFLLGMGLYAQDNDTSLLRKLGVTEIHKGLYVHAFQGKKDTCEFFFRKIDSLARPVWERSDMGCYGFNELTESSFTYDSGFLYRVDVIQNDEPLNTSYYTYEGPNMPSEIRVIYHQTNDSTVAVFDYFMHDRVQPDSNTSIFIDQFGDTTRTKTIARFDELGRVVQIVTIDQERVTLQEVSYELNGDDKPVSVASSLFGDQPMFVQTYYEYDKDGRLVKSYNSRNQAQLYYYYDNGLISNIMNYNGKGELESEFIYTYKY